MSLLTTLSSSQTFAKNVFFENTHTKVAFVSRCFSCVWKEIPDISTNGQTSTADHDFQGPNAKDLEESLAFQALDETIGSRKRVTAWNCLSGLRSGRVRWIPALKCNAFWPKTCRRIIQVQYCLFSIAPEGRIMLHLFLLPVMHWEKKLWMAQMETGKLFGQDCVGTSKGVNVRKMFKHVMFLLGHVCILKPWGHVYITLQNWKRLSALLTRIVSSSLYHMRRDAQLNSNRSLILDQRVPKFQRSLIFHFLFCSQGTLTSSN